MSDSAPLVTINIVTRNRKAELVRSIESVYAQTYRPMEIVVVDNNSADGSAEEVEARWPEIRLIRLHRNIGCQPGRNIGMKNSAGKYVFNLDDDGALDPKAMGLMVARFEAEDDIAVIDASIAPMSLDRAHLIRHPRVPSERYVANFSGGASGIRRSVLEETGYFPEYPRGHAEADLALRILEARYQMVRVPDVIMYHAVSDVERNHNVIMYYSIWHRLETCFRLEPWRRCIPVSFWKLLVDLKVALRHGTIFGYVAGVARFVYELPRILRARQPVSKWATEKVDFLTYHYITDGAESRGFQKFSLWKAMLLRLRGQHKRLQPPPLGSQTDTTPEPASAVCRDVGPEDPGL